MKIEKLTENKIRIIINNKDLQDNHIDLHTLMTKSLENQKLFLEMLQKAETQVGFNTDGCRLLIEGFSSTDDNFIFTITKFEKSKTTENFLEISQKRLSVKRKCFNPKSNCAIYVFNNFDNFCDFCKFLNNLHNFDFNKISKDFSLYLYNNCYYLVISNINTSYSDLNCFYSAISEFGKCVTFSNNFKSKLIEHGKVVMKKNALNLGIKYFN